MQRDAAIQSAGIVKALAFRTADGLPMRVTTSARVLANRGIDQENRPPGKRSLTLLSAAAWADACRDVGADLPWHARRANVLVEGVDLRRTIGRLLMIGEVTLRVHGETKPCRLMDEQHAGLRAALMPECRGGVYGQVLTDGVIHVGDPIHLVPAATPC